MKQLDNNTYSVPMVDVWKKTNGKQAIFNRVAIDNIDYLRSLYANTDNRNLSRVCKNKGITLEKHSDDNLCLTWRNVKVFYSYGRFTAFSVNGTRFICVEYGTYSRTTTKWLNMYLNLAVNRCYSDKKQFAENNRYNWISADSMPVNDYDAKGDSCLNETVSIEGVENETV